MDLKGSNVGTVFVSSGFPHNRYRRVYRVDKERLDDDEEDEVHEPAQPKETFAIENRVGEYATCTTMHEKYSERPRKLEKMCLAQFATVYENCRESTDGISFDKDDCSDQNGGLTMFGSEMLLPKYIQLDNEKQTKMKLRTLPKVLRIHSSSKKKDFEELYAELLLFYPWRDEKDDLHWDDPIECTELFNREKDTVKENRLSIFPFSKTIERVSEYLESAEDNRPQQIGDTLNAAAEQENEDDMEEMEPMDTNELPDESNVSKKKEKIIMKPIQVEDDDLLLEMTRKLSEEQMIVLGKFVDYAKKLLVLSNSPSIEIHIEPPQIIVTGEGGTGKSFVINITSKWMEKILRRAGDDPSKPKVLILAPTGIAASLINGTTLHTGLGFQFGCKKYLPMRDQKREFYRKNFEELQLVIMDEFSMISSDRLYDVHRRLQEILISRDLFGGRAMMIVGDIMQLPPVLGRKVFTSPFSQQNRAMYSSNLSIWKNMEVVTLLVNQRQGISKWTECLNRIRVGELTEEDKQLLETRRLSNFPDFDADSACHVMFENYSVNNHNLRLINSSNHELVEINSEGLYPRGYRLCVKEHGTIEDTSFRKVLRLKKNARVILTFNVNLADSLVNGMIGTVLDFIYDGNRVKAVVVAFDNPNVGIEQRREHPNDSSRFIEQNGTPIYRSTLEHPLRNGKSGAKGKTSQFPFRLSWANTGHSLQGVGFGEGSDLVCHGRDKDKTMPKNMYYVMFSRASSIENFYLDEKVKLSDIACDNSSLLENRRLKDLSIAIGVKEEVFDIFYINIRSFSKHKEDLLCDVYAKRSMCLCLVETWLDPLLPKNHRFPERVMYEASFGAGRGCCAIVPNCLQLISSITTEYFQMVSFAYKDNIQVIVTYLSSPEKVDYGDYVTKLKKMKKSNMETLLIGDFNFDVKEKNLVSVYLEECKLQEMIHEPTQEAGRTIDHLYVSPNLVEKLEVKVMFKYYSDHAAMQIKLKN